MYLIYIILGFGGKLGASFSNDVDNKSSRELFKLLRFLDALPLILRRFANIGDTFSTVTTKLDGNTPIRVPNFPRHHPSSTSPKNSIISPTPNVSSSLLFCV